MDRSGIITFLTDFGLSDAYTAMMKGVVLSINRNADIIDITHNIRFGSVYQGAGILKDAYSYFPEGTVHVAVVDPGVGSSRRLLAVKAAGHFFLGPDNGILWPIIKDAPEAEIVELTEKKFFLPDITSTFHGRDVFAPVAAHISLGTEISRLGHPITDPEKLIMPLSYIKDGILKGEIIRVDNFGNLITNITLADLSSFLGDKTPVIKIGEYKISGVSDTYSGNDKDKLMALINSSNHLEIAVNLGRASEYIRMATDQIPGTCIEVY